MTGPALTFEAPGPGSWHLDSLHFPRPVTAYWARMHPQPFAAGFGEMAAFFGAPFRTRRIAYVNGFCYSSGDDLTPTELEERERRATAVFEGRLWRESVREWHEVCKPASIQAQLAIQAIDPDALPDAALVEHLRRCHDHHAAMCRQHMRFTGTASIPPGNFLAHTREWTGMSTVKLLGLMRGASLVSGGASTQHSAMVEAFRADPAARAALDSSEEPGGLLARLRAEPTATGRALNGYLDFAGHRLLDGFDISNPCALELPDVLLRSIRTAIDDEDRTETGIETEVAEIRAAVPTEHRAAFDELLADARSGYSVRDERGIYGDIWASGLMRRAALAAGRRLVAAGRLAEVGDIVFADTDEMCALLEGASTPTADDLARRRLFHQTYTAKDAPEHLGDADVPEPDPETLGPGIARLMRAMGAATGEMFASSEEEHEETVIRGLGASAGQCEGVVRRVRGPADFDAIEQGDVLLTEATTEAFNILLPLLSAIITDSGGALSHAAIVSREYGIPGVVGTRDATVRIADGTRVRVDGDAGTVTVLG